MSHSPPLSPPEKLAVIAIVWGCMVIVSIPLQEAVSAVPFCWATRTSIAQFSVCLPTISLVASVIYWLEAERDMMSIVAHYWPAGLMASVFTTMLLWRSWRRS